MTGILTSVTVRGGRPLKVSSASRPLVASSHW